MVLENEALGLDQPEELKPFSRTSPPSPSTPPSPPSSSSPSPPPSEIVNNLANDLGNFIIDPEITSEDEDNAVESEQEEEEEEELLTRNKGSKRNKKKSKPAATMDVNSEEEEYEAIGMVKKSKRGKSAVKKSSILIPSDDVDDTATEPALDVGSKLEEEEEDGMPLPAKKSRRAKKGKLSTASPSISGSTTPALDMDVLSPIGLTSADGGGMEGDDGREMSKKDKRRAKEAAKSGIVDELVRLSCPLVPHHLNPTRR